MPRGIRRAAGAEAPVEAQQPEAVLSQPVSRRADETRRERRRRDDGDMDRMASQKLHIRQEIQDKARREGKVLRWIMDTRLVSAEADDWDKVEGVEPIQANPVMGTEERLVLCEKYADWDAEDRAADDMKIDGIEQRTMAGQLQDDGRSSAGLVVPKGQTNRVTTQRGL